MFRISKRGQEGVTLTTLILIVIGVVVAAVIILGATGAFDFIFGKTQQIPLQALETVAQGCKVALEAKLINDYCYEFKQISDNEYINCQDARVQDSLAKTSSTPASSIQCNTELVNNARKDVCNKVPVRKQDTTIVNGVKCAEILLEENKDTAG